MDFFISPEYKVPPISTIFLSKLIIMNASELTPSTLPLALNPGAHIILKSTS